MSPLLLGATIVLLLVAGIVSADIMGLAFWKSNQFPVEGKTILLTGSSQGMGREIARLLAARGANLILVARTTQNLESALEHAKAHAKNPQGQRFTYISADVASESENARILKEATAWNNGKMPEVVWCVAGSSKPGLFIETSTDTLRKQMELNYFATAYMAHMALQAWLYPKVPYSAQEKHQMAEPSRKFIMTSSSLAFVNLAGYSPYSPAKAAIRSLADGLRSEVQLYNAARRSKTNNTGVVPAPFDVEINVIFPGSMLSPGFENENKTKHPVSFELESSDPKQTELEAATAAIEGLEAGNFMTPTNWLANLMRLATLSGSQKNNVVLDLLGAWIATVIWVFVTPDLNGKVWGWGKKNGMPAFRPNAQ
ncbi:3-ketodihydrosphingosine reductase, Tsc10 [Decorospora gaudefroyi]|uniref:3-dehydrosphinganine reductase n=1 Tax=Decorospora gaudefroyi TaxID=184978 RepID=A0A6A5KBY8_9PLEO|nr:3-ketodihydrosphingosine reductase, Tsc10 [Decorospora gaudefroyi]